MNTRGTVLITDNVHSIMIQEFEKAGFVVDYFPNYTNEDVYNSIENYIGIIINSKTKINNIKRAYAAWKSLHDASITPLATWQMMP